MSIGRFVSFQAAQVAKIEKSKPDPMISWILFIARELVNEARQLNQAFSIRRINMPISKGQY
jgi:hypothetical protein